MNRVVFITGASSGIGEYVAREFARRGYSLALVARREEKLQRLAQELSQGTVRVLALRADVTDAVSLRKAAEDTVRELGRIDIVMANAGFGVVGEVAALTTSDFTRQFDTNVTGVLDTIYATLPMVRETKGSFVLVGSVNGHLSLAGSAPYAMSKFAIRALATALFYELRPEGVGVTLLSPGFVESEIRKVDNQGALHSKAKDPMPTWLVVPGATAAKAMVRAIEKRKREAVITGHGKVIVFVNQYFPWLVHFILRTFPVHARRSPKPTS